MRNEKWKMENGKDLRTLNVELVSSNSELSLLFYPSLL